MKAITKNFLSLFLLTCVLLATAASFAQQTQASLTGQVLDPQGASIPGAEVTITNTGPTTVTTQNAMQLPLAVAKPL